MLKKLGSRSNLILLTALSLLSFVARALLDWKYVFPFFMEFSQQSELISSFVYFLIIISVLAALLNLSKSTIWALITILVFQVMQFLLLGVFTSLALCPSPCPTIWPIGELIIWSSTVSGFLGLLSLAIFWRQKNRA